MTTIETTKIETPAVEAKPAVRKPVAKKAPARKKTAAAKKAAPKSAFDMFEGSVIAVPFKFANKTFLASLGLLSVVGKEVVGKIDAYAKDGEKVRDEIQASLDEMRHDVVEQVTEARNRVMERFGKAA